MSNLVMCDVEAGVALVTLNRPDRMNAVNLEMGAAFDEVESSHLEQGRGVFEA